MICAYLLHRQVKRNAADALKFYDETRTSDHKGVTIPSQRRYVGYYDQMLKAPPAEKYKERMLFLKGMKFLTVPHHAGLAPQIVIEKRGTQMGKIYESLPITSASRFDRELCLEFQEKIPVSGDTLITIFSKPVIKLKKERLFQFWFNTYFVTDEASSLASNGDLFCPITDNPKNLEPAKVKRTLSNQSDSIKHCVRAAESFTFDTSKCLVLALNKQELDKANKDRTHQKFDANFKVICYFEKEARPGFSIGSMSQQSMSMEDDSEDDLSDTDTEIDDNEQQRPPAKSTN